MWIALCGVGLVVGVIVGFGLRRRHVISPEPARPETREVESSAAIEAEPRSEPAGTSDDGVVIETAVFGAEARRSRVSQPDQESTTAPVIDLRRSADGPADAKPPASEPAVATLETAGSAEPDAEIIDLRDRVTQLVPIHNLQFVKGIGPALDLELRKHGVITLRDFVAMERDVAESVAVRVPEVTAKRLRKKLRGRARSMLAAAGEWNIAEPPDTSALRRIDGIGPTMARWLETQGVTRLEELAALDKPGRRALQERLADYPGRIAKQRWVHQARGLTAPDRTR